MRLLLSALMLTLATPAVASVHIDIDKTDQNMTVFVDGIQTYSWPVSTGTRGYDTPNGSYGTNGLHEEWYSKQWDARMPYSIFFTTRGHAIHATDEIQNLGKPASHGCVRLSMENAQTLFYLVKEEGEEETTVSVNGEIQVAEAPPPRYVQPRPAPQRPAHRAPMPPEGWIMPPPRYYEPPRYVRPVPKRRFRERRRQRRNWFRRGY